MTSNGPIFLERVEATPGWVGWGDDQIHFDGEQARPNPTGLQTQTFCSCVWWADSKLTREMEIKAQYYEFLSVRERVTLEGGLIRLKT